MKVLRRLLSFAYGFLLMYFVSIWFTGFMAARQISREYFRFFAPYGPFGKEAAHAVLGVALHIIPDLLLLVAGVLLVTIVFTRDRRASGVVAILGAAMSYIFWVAYFSADGNNETWSLAAALDPYIKAPWWAWPTIVAPGLGLTVAYALLPKSNGRHAGA
jgi:hypothetical protein